MGGSLADYTQQANLKDSMAEMKSKHEVVLQLRETDKLWKKKKWEQMHPEAAKKKHERLLQVKKSEKKHKDEKRKDMKLHKKQEVREKQASKYEDLLTASYHHEKQQTQKPYKHMKRVKMLQSPVIPVSKEDKDVLNNLMKASETAHTEQASQTKQDSMDEVNGIENDVFTDDDTDIDSVINGDAVDQKSVLSRFYGSDESTASRLANPEDTGAGSTKLIPDSFSSDSFDTAEAQDDMKQMSLEMSKARTAVHKKMSPEQKKMKALSLMSHAIVAAIGQNDKVGTQRSGLLAASEKVKRTKTPKKTDAAKVDKKMLDSLAKQVKKEKKRVKHVGAVSASGVAFAKKTAQAARSAYDAEAGAAAVAHLAHNANVKNANQHVAHKVKTVPKAKKAVMLSGLARIRSKTPMKTDAAKVDKKMLDS